MSDEKRDRSTGNGGRPSEVLTALPRSRPHRRSDKRATATTKTEVATPVRAATGPITDTPEAPAAEKPVPKPAAARKAPKAASARKAAAKPASARRAAPTAGAKPATRKPKTGQATAKPASRARRGPTLHQPPQPRGLPPQPEPRERASHGRTDILATAVQAAAELTEIGLSAGARALRQAVSRLPRP